MATTARQTIERAMKRLGLLSEEETMTAPQAVDGLTILNDLMFSFPARGINYTHVALGLSDNVNLPDAHIRNLVLLLSVELTADYGKDLKEPLNTQAMQAEAQLQAAYPPTMGNTVLGLINRALQRIRVFAGSGNGGPALPWYFVSATNETEAVRMFNDMMHGLGPKGVYYAHTTLAANGTVNMPDEQIRNLVLLLVREFSNANGVPIPAQVMVEIVEAERALQAAYYVVPPAQVDDGLTNTLLYGTTNIERI